jgi:uncharacterized membrane protein
MENVTALQFIVALCLGIGLAGAAGLKAFYPLLAVSAGAHLGWLPLNESYAWLGQWPALLAFGAAAILEFIGDKIPVLDHGLHAAGLLAAPIAGTVLVASNLPGADPLLSTTLGLIAGGVPAGAIHVTRSALRPLSTVGTGGIANPAVSLGEDALAMSAIVVAFLIPVVMAILTIGLAVGCFFIFRYLKRRFLSKLGRSTTKVGREVQEAHQVSLTIDESHDPVAH